MKLPINDLHYILRKTNTLWESLRDQRLFITGGTGFFGCWLLESLVEANRIFKLNASAVILTRNPQQFEKKCPHLFLESCLIFQQGDISNFEFPQGKFSYIIHAAAEVGSSLNKEHSKSMLEAMVQGTKHILEFAKHAGIKGFLLTSSGSIYGQQPSNIPYMPEDYTLFSTHDAKNQDTYCQGKRRAEELCAYYAEHFNLNIKIARCFAFVGPHLPLYAHFAMGNFIKDRLEQRAIELNSDGSAYRSYLYAADLTIWLWTILIHGKTMRPYNVGSDEALSIAELAYKIANDFGSPLEVYKKQSLPGRCIERYVPDISRARKELGLMPGINLSQAVQSTLNWYTLWNKK